MREIKIMIWLVMLWFRRWYPGFRRGVVPHLGYGPKLGKCCISSQIEMEILPNLWRIPPQLRLSEVIFEGDEIISNTI